MVVSLVLLIVGLALLLAGAELLVRGASQLAVSLGISPLVVGLTVVSYGTSAPELAIGIGAALDGQPDIVLGNVVGSNIANVLLILGLAALVAPLVVTRRLVWLDVPIMVAISLLVTLLALDGHLERWLGAALLLGSLGYTCLQLVLGRREGAAMARAVGPRTGVFAALAQCPVGAAGALPAGAGGAVAGGWRGEHRPGFGRE